jgi:hypothetical protein
LDDVMHELADMSVCPGWPALLVCPAPTVPRRHHAGHGYFV